MIIDTDKLREQLGKEEQEEVRRIEAIGSDRTADVCFQHAEQKWYGIYRDLETIEYWAKKLLPEEVSA